MNQSIDYAAIMPVLIVALGALGVLLTDLFTPDERKGDLAWLTAGVLVIALFAELGLWIGGVANTPRLTFCATPGHTGVLGCSYSADRFSLTIQTLLLAGTLLTVLMAPRRFKVPFGEYHFLILCSLTGALVMAAARDFITMTVGLETLSLPAYALVGFGRKSGGEVTGAEAALKFFLMSVASTAVMLFGISLVYGVTGSVYFANVQAVLHVTGYHASILATGMVLTLAGFAFKVSAVPFHFWTPEVYVGAPVPVAAYLSVVSKTAGFAGLILTLEIAFRTEIHNLGTLIAILAAITMTLGNVVALRQRSAVRLLAWSTIGQAGYVLVPLAVTTWNGTDLGREAVGAAGNLGPAVTASVAYLVFYAAMNLGAFGVVSALGGTLPGGGELADYRSLSSRQPRAAWPLGLFLLCLAGLPPGLMGLFAKVAVFRAVISGGLTWLAVVMAVNVVIALFYYLRWAAALFAPATGDQRSTLSRSIPLGPRIAVGLALVVTVFFSLYPAPAFR
ncbi:NADH-quinone oxidoreductase subunit N [Actinospica sp.]|jgi:NADH-quinone oxidoreductase subunit N|uniref:NADH-quinone oxidoreductase subunit N n=1 Tax=Actinospica sp. TaxID=1872142 RepID=UPI002B550F2C|nr:NADH-quinone oxidoreductase subunit N [Actinospica sp.]HWG23627.1 NADH-quinone oxidoreductase subunit N [Actinospica sp.]